MRTSGTAILLLGFACVINACRAPAVETAPVSQPQKTEDSSEPERGLTEDSTSALALPDWWEDGLSQSGGRLTMCGQGAGSSRSEAIQAARAASQKSLAETRQVTIRGFVYREMLSETTTEDGLYEAARTRSSTFSATAAELAGCQVEEEVACENGDPEHTWTAYAKVSVLRERIYPQERLQDLLNARGDRPEDAWFQELEALADTYRVEGESALLGLTLRALQRYRRLPEDLIRLAEWYEDEGSVAGAIMVLERLSASGTDVDRRIFALRNRLMSWENLVDALLVCVHRHQDRGVVRLGAPNGTELNVGHPRTLTVTVTSTTPMAFFWLDVEGLYRWEWGDVTVLDPGTYTVTAQASTVGPMWIVAVGSGEALSDLEGFLQVHLEGTDAATTIAERDPVDQGDLQHIRRFEAFLELLMTWVGRPGTCTDVIELEVR